MPYVQLVLKTSREFAGTGEKRQKKCPTVSRFDGFKGGCNCSSNERSNPHHAAVHFGTPSVGSRVRVTVECLVRSIPCSVDPFFHAQETRDVT
jgi:hypothetical protein